MNSTSFSDLYSRIQNWSADDEDILLRKIKEFTDKYTKKCDEINHNVDNIDKHINLLETEFYNSSNKLKNISIKRFMEHVVEEDLLVTDEIKPQKQRDNQIILSKEERDRNILNKFRSSITKSLENLNIKNLIDIKENIDNNSILDDDNMSVSSSKYLQNLQKQKNLNLKLPYLIGTIDYFKNEYLGITTNQSLIENILSNSSFNNNTYVASNYCTNLNEKNVNYNQQSNIHQNNNPIYKAKLSDNLDKLSMNMNLIEQIYEKKNTYIPNTSSENELNEILNKNGKNNFNYPKDNKNNDFFDENKIHTDQFRNIYKYSKLNNNNSNTIQDQNFVDFTKLNSNMYNNETKIPEGLINNYLDIRNNYFKANEIENGVKLNNDLISKQMNHLNENNKNLFDYKNDITNKEERINSKNINNNNIFNRNHGVSLDNFLKKTNLIEDNFLDNEEDDNTGLFNKKNEAKFNLLIKNSKNNLFTNQDCEIVESKNEKIVETNQNFSDIHKPEKSEEQTKIDTDKRLGKILKLIDDSIEETPTEKITNMKNEEEKVLKNKEIEKNEIFEGKTKQNKNKYMKENKTKNLFSDSLLEEDNDNIFSVKTKIQGNDINKNKLGLDKKLTNQPAEKKSSLLKTKNTLKMLFNEEDEDEEIRIMNPLEIVNKIDKKSTNLNEKLNYLLKEDLKNNHETKDEFSIQSKIDFIKKNEEHEKLKVNENNKLEKSLGLLVFNEETIDENKQSNKNILTIDRNNFASNKKIEQENTTQNKFELHNVFKDIFNNNGEINKNENKISAYPQVGETILNLTIKVEDKMKEGQGLFEVIEKQTENNDFIFREKNILIDNTLKIPFENVKNTIEENILNSNNLKKKKSNKSLNNLNNTNNDETKENNIKISIAESEHRIHNVKTDFIESSNLNENLHEFVLNHQTQSKFNLFNQVEINKSEKVEYDYGYIHEIKDQNNMSFNLKEYVIFETQKNNCNLEENSTNIFKDENKSNYNGDSEQQLFKIENDFSKFDKINLDKSTTEENKDKDKEKSEKITSNKEEFQKEKNYIENEKTLIPVDLSSQIISDNPSLQPKINFEDLEYEENFIEKVEIQNKESNKNFNKTKQMKKAINFADPLKPLKKNIKKEISITKPDSKKKNPVNNISRKSVFEDSEEENDEEVKFESQNIFDEKKEKLKKSNNDEIKEKLNTGEININENKEIIQKEKMNEDKSQEKRKSIKINNFSEIKKILDQKLQAFKNINPEENNFFIPIKINNVPTNSLEYKSDKIQQIQHENQNAINFNISIVKNKKKAYCKRFTLQNPALDIKPNVKMISNIAKKDIFVDSNKNIYEINSSTIVEEIKEYEFPKIKNFEELSQSIHLNHKIENNFNSNLDLGEIKQENLNEIKNETHEFMSNQTRLEENSEDTNKSDKLNKHLQNLEKEDYKNNSKKMDFEYENNFKDALIQDNQKNETSTFSNECLPFNQNSVIPTFQNKEINEKIKNIEESDIDKNNLSNERNSSENVSSKDINLDMNKNFQEEADKKLNFEKNENENYNIKKAKVIGFNDDEDKNEQENFSSSKSQDLQTKKKENEKVKVLKKKKVKNDLKNLSKQMITNTNSNKDSKKTLNFDEDEE